MLAEFILAADTVACALSLSEENIVDPVALDNLVGDFPTWICVEQRYVRAARPCNLWIGWPAPLSLVIFPAQHDGNARQRGDAPKLGVICAPSGLRNHRVVAL